MNTCYKIESFQCTITSSAMDASATGLIEKNVVLTGILAIADLLVGTVGNYLERRMLIQNWGNAGPMPPLIGHFTGLSIKQLLAISTGHTGSAALLSSYVQGKGYISDDITLRVKINSGTASGWDEVELGEINNGDLVTFENYYFETNEVLEIQIVQNGKLARHVLGGAQCYVDPTGCLMSNTKGESNGSYTLIAKEVDLKEAQLNHPKISFKKHIQHDEL